MILFLQTIIILPLIYMIGSGNFSIVYFRLFKGQDIRELYSGNPGVTNVYRSAGLWPAACLLCLDLFRASISALIALKFLPFDMLTLAASALVLGNRFPIFHNFKGGKGVANLLGFTLFIAPRAAGIACLVWLIIYGITKKPFIGSFVMISVLILGLLYHTGLATTPIIGAIALLLLIIHAHKINIQEFMYDRQTKDL